MGLFGKKDKDKSKQSKDALDAAQRSPSASYNGSSGMPMVITPSDRVDTDRMSIASKVSRLSNLSRFSRRSLRRSSLTPNNGAVAASDLPLLAEDGANSRKIVFGSSPDLSRSRASSIRSTRSVVVPGAERDRGGRRERDRDYESDRQSAGVSRSNRRTSRAVTVDVVRDEEEYRRERERQRDREPLYYNSPTSSTQRRLYPDDDDAGYARKSSGRSDRDRSDYSRSLDRDRERSYRSRDDNSPSEQPKHLRPQPSRQDSHPPASNSPSPPLSSYSRSRRGNYSDSSPQTQTPPTPASSPELDAVDLPKGRRSDRDERDSRRVQEGSSGRSGSRDERERYGYRDSSRERDYNREQRHEKGSRSKDDGYFPNTTSRTRDDRHSPLAGSSPLLISSPGKRATPSSPGQSSSRNLGGLGPGLNYLALHNPGTLYGAASTTRKDHSTMGDHGSEVPTSPTSSAFFSVDEGSPRSSPAKPSPLSLDGAIDLPDVHIPSPRSAALAALPQPVAFNPAVKAHDYIAQDKRTHSPSGSVDSRSTHVAGVLPSIAMANARSARTGVSGSPSGSRRGAGRRPSLDSLVSGGSGSGSGSWNGSGSVDGSGRTRTVPLPSVGGGKSVVASGRQTERAGNRARHGTAAPEKGDLRRKSSLPAIRQEFYEGDDSEKERERRGAHRSNSIRSSGGASTRSERERRKDSDRDRENGLYDEDTWSTWGDDDPTSPQGEDRQERLADRSRRVSTMSNASELSVFESDSEEELARQRKKKEKAKKKEVKSRKDKEPASPEMKDPKQEKKESPKVKDTLNMMKISPGAGSGMGARKKAVTANVARLTYDEVAMTEDELKEDMKEIWVAMRLFMNSRMIEAEDVLLRKADKRLYYSVGYTLVQTLKAVMSFEPGDLEAAIQCCSDTLTIANLLRRPAAVTDTVGRLLRGTVGLGSIHSMTIVQRHAELIFAECLMLRAIIGIIYAGDMFAFLKEALNLRNAHAIYRNLGRFVEEFDNEAKNRKTQSAELDEDFRSGVALGNGTISVILALLPAKLLKLMELVGFNGDRAYGLKTLMAAGKWSSDSAIKKPGIGPEQEGIRRVLCDIVLLLHHLVMGNYIPVTYIDIKLADNILQYSLKQYPDGVFFLYFSSRLYSTQTLGDAAIKQYYRTLQCQREYIQLQHIAHWDLALTYIALGQWQRGLECFTILGRESNWSKSVYAYARAVCLYQIDNNSEQAREVMKTVPDYLQRIAGKSVPLEKFIAARARKFARQGNRLIAPGVELAYVLNALGMSPRYSLFDEHLDLVSAELARLHKCKNADEWGNGSGEFWDDVCTAHLLRAIILRMIAHPEAHIAPRPARSQIPVDEANKQSAHSFNKVFKHAKDCKTDHHVAWFAHYELGRLYVNMGEDGQARKHLGRVVEGDIKEMRSDRKGKGKVFLQNQAVLRSAAAIKNLDGKSVLPP